MDLNRYSKNITIIQVIVKSFQTSTIHQTDSMSKIGTQHRIIYVDLKMPSLYGENSDLRRSIDFSPGSLSTYLTAIIRHKSSYND